jgi:transposase
VSRTIIKYSLSFRRKIVSEIEKGIHTIATARRMYDINGNGTVERWLRDFGKNTLIGKVVRVETRDEIEKLKLLESDKRQLESALARAHLRILALEQMLELASKEVGQDLKKSTTRKHKHSA